MWVARLGGASVVAVHAVSVEGDFAVVESCTVDVSRARTELGYELVRTREEGLEELAGG